MLLPLQLTERANDTTVAKGSPPVFDRGFRKSSVNDTTLSVGHAQKGASGEARSWLVVYSL
jgi:hypothetical protein